MNPLSLQKSGLGMVKVASSHPEHHYHRCLYDGMGAGVLEIRASLDIPAPATWPQMDVYHLHWPEWVGSGATADVLPFLRELRSRGIRILSTQHNLRPHQPTPQHLGLYEGVAALVDGVIHHTPLGQAQAREMLPYRHDVLHAVIPHGHFGELMRYAESREVVEKTLGLKPCALRLGILGAPRTDKDVLGFMRAFAQCHRSDLGLLVTSLRPQERSLAPQDPRIRAELYEFVPRDVYNRYLASLDVLVFPVDPGTYMTLSGVFADAVAAGMACMGTSWGFLSESLGGACLEMGDTPDEWTRALNRLSGTKVAEASRAARALQDRYDWHHSAVATGRLLSELMKA